MMREYATTLVRSLAIAVLLALPCAAQTTWYVDDDAPHDPCPGDPKRRPKETFPVRILAQTYQHFCDQIFHTRMSQIRSSSWRNYVRNFIHTSTLL